MPAEEEREAYLAEHPEKRSVYDGPSADEQEARFRLGAWLATDCSRIWSHWHEMGPGVTGRLHGIELRRSTQDGYVYARGEGPTLADAILAALERAQS